MAATQPAAASASAVPADVAEVVRALVEKQTKTVLYVTGGAVSALSWLLATPGASSTVLDARVPYSGPALAQLLGEPSPPERYACAEVAAAMARAAAQQAAALTPFGAGVLGVGATCALRTGREKKGEHKVFVALHDGVCTTSYSLVLAKGARERAVEDEVASRLLLGALAADPANGVECDLLTPALVEEEQLQKSVAAVASPVHELLNGRVSLVDYSGAQPSVDLPRGGPNRVYLPGSFNPLHDGHKRLLAAAVQAKGGGAEGCFELSVGNADKGFMAEEEVLRRVAQFQAAGLPLVLTQAPLFTQKAELLPGSTFVVGYDTAVRLVKPEYYGDETAMLLQFAKLVYRGCSFLVAGRLDESSGRFLTLADVPVPDSLQHGGGLFQAVPEEVFRVDISSTQLRAAGQGRAPAQQSA